MDRASSLLRRLGIIFLMLNLFLPFSIDSAFAQDEPTGALTIVLVDANSSIAIGGGAFTVADANGNVQQVNGDADGYSDVWGLAPGTATVTQTAAPGGYQLGTTTKTATVSAGSPATITFANAFVPPPDADGDGIPDSQDSTPNGEPDTDGDGIADGNDTTPNGDDDGDGVDNLADNCPAVTNIDQADGDGDGAGDACDAPPSDVIDNDQDSGTDTDTDIDTTTDTDSDTDTGIRVDTDGDGIADESDTCLDVANKDQLDTDSDGTGDACDDDDDNDGLTDTDEAEAGTDPLKADTDGDGVSDGDEVDAGTDPLVSDASTEPCKTNTPANQDDTSTDGAKDDPCAQLITSLQSTGFGIQSVGITLDKSGVYSAPDTTYYPNGSITYTFVVTNTGTEALGDVEITDSLLDASPILVGVLGPSGSSSDTATVYATYALTSTDAAGSEVENTASVAANTPGGDLVTASSSTTVQLATNSATISDVLFRAYTPTEENLADPDANDSSPVEPELQSEDFFCGSYVHYYDEITVATGNNATFLLQNNFGINSTGQPGVGFGDIVSVRVVSGNATASLQSESISGGNIQAKILLSDVDAGEVIKVRVVAQLVCGSNAADATGNVQANLVTDGGNQTINLKVQKGDFEEPAPAISIAKGCPTAFPEAAVVGDTVRFPVTIENTGNVALSGVFVTDDQSGLFDGSFSTMLTPNAPTETVDFLYTLTSTDIGNGFVTNTARVDTFQTEEQVASSGNCAFTPAEPILELGKSGPTEITRGDPLSYTITVTNTGDGEATNVLFRDVLPVTGGTWTWTENGIPSGDLSPANCYLEPVVDGETGQQRLTCEGINLATSGDDATFTVVLTSDTTPSVECGGEISNTVVLGEGFINLENVDDDKPNSVTTNVVCSAELQITKTPDGETVLPFDPIAFTIVVENIGEVDATNVTLNDPLPSDPGTLNWTVDTDTPHTFEDCAVTDNTLACSIPTLAAGTTASVTVEATAGNDPAGCGLINNPVATADAVNADPVTDAGSITVECVNLTKTTANGTQSDTIAPGDNLTFTIVAENRGPGVVQDVSFEDNLPEAGLDWDIDTVVPDPIPGGGTCAISDDSPQVLTCSGIDLDSTQPFSITVSSTTSATEPSCGPQENTVTLTSGDELFTDHNTAVTTINCASDVSLVKSVAAADATILPGDIARFTITLTNNGTAAAGNAGFTDVLPAGLDWSWTEDGSETHTYCDTTTAPGTLTCSGIDLPTGEDFVVVLTATVPDDDLSFCDGITNTASPLGFTETGTALDDNTASIDVLCSPSITISKVATDGQDAIQPGGTASYTITVNNSGLGDSDSTGFSDLLPGGLDWHWTENGGAQDPDDGFCAIDTDVDSGQSTLTCTNVHVPGLDSFVVVLTAIVPDDGTVCGDIVNEVALTSNEEPGGEGDDNSATINVNCTATIDLAKENMSGVAIAPGGDLTFKITVTNSGNGPALDVSFSDSLPVAGLDWSIVNAPIDPPGDGTCAITGIAGSQTLTCTGIDMSPNGDSFSFEVTSATATTAVACGTVTNTVSLTGETYTETNTDNNSASTQIECNPSVEVMKECPTFGDGTGVGAEISYKVTVTNDGNVDLTNVEVVDQRTETGGEFQDENGDQKDFPDTFAAGESVVRYFVTTIQQHDAEDGNAANSVIVTATELETGATAFAGDDNAGCPFTPVTTFTVAKACPTVASLDGARINDTVIYPITITNTGDLELTITDLAESRTSSSLYTSSTELDPSHLVTLPFTIAAGENTTIYSVDVINSTDVVNQNVNNHIDVTAQVTIGDDSEPTTLAVQGADAMSDETTGCPYVPVVDYTFSKSCPSFDDGNGVGSTIAYKVTVENTGDVTLTNLILTDSRGAEGGFYEDAAGTIPSSFPTEITPNDGAITRYYVTTIQPEDAQNGNAGNAATIDADQIDASTISAGGEAGCPFTPVAGIEITKSCPTTTDELRVGDNIDYAIHIENTGDVALTDIHVLDDPDHGGRVGHFNSALPTELGPGETWDGTFTSEVTSADAILGSINNHIEVTANTAEIAGRFGAQAFLGVAVPDEPDVSDTADADCAFTPAFGVTVTKACPTYDEGVTQPRLGDTIRYAVTITNTGDVPVTGFSVSDTRTTGHFVEAIPDTLAANQVLNLTFEDTIQSGDITTGTLNNSVTVTGIVTIGTTEHPVNETADTTANNDELGCTFTPFASVEVTKSCPVLADGAGLTGARVGDPIYYQVTIENTGDVPLTGVVVSDNRANEGMPGYYDGGYFVADRGDTEPSDFPDTLGVDESVTRWYRGSITSSDAELGDVGNYVSLSATELGESQPSASAGGEGGCDYTPVSGIEVIKSCPTVADGTRAGAEITYNVTIENTGDLPLTNIHVTESRLEGLDGFSPALPDQLDPGDTYTGTYTTRVTFGDAALGSINNHIEVTADIAGPTEGPGPQFLGAEPPSPAQSVNDADDANCPFNPATTFTVTKACPTTTGLGVGSQVVYPITITNTGDIDVTITDLAESRDGGTFYSDDALGTELTLPFTVAPGTPVTIYYADNIDGDDAINGDVDNTVTVTGQVQIGEGAPTVLDPEVANAMTGDTEGCPFLPDTSIQLTKGCPDVAPNTRVGTAIIYPITITNTGEVPLSGINVSEQGRSGTFHSDPSATSDPLTMPLAGVTLAPAGSDGDTYTIYYRTPVTQGDATNGNVNNTANVTATVTIGDVESTVEGSGSTGTCAFLPFEQVTITKSCPDIATGARAGQAITYNVTIENTGDVPLTNILVTDDRSGSFDPENPFPTTLNPDDAPVTRVFTSAITLQDAEDGNVDNSATVTADAISGEVTATLSESVERDCVFDPFEAITITKDCPTIAENARAGDWITYKVTLTNSGDVALSGITVSDTRAGMFYLNAGDDPETATANPFPSTLPVDDPATTDVDEGTVVRYFKSKITSADASNYSVDNSVSVDASSVVPAGEGTNTTPVSDSVDADCPFNPVIGIDIAKSCPDVADDTRVGTSIIYPITITNIGDVPVTGIDVTEQGRTGDFYSDAAASSEVVMPLAGVTLAPSGEDGDEYTVYFKTNITHADALAGNVDNSVSVSATAGEATVRDQATATGEACQFAPFVDIEITKTCPTIDAGTRVDADITYQVTITNLGDIPLDITSVTDDRGDSFDNPFPAMLAPQGEDGDSATQAFTDQITLADAASGNVDNIVTVNTSQGVSDTYDTAVNNEGGGCLYTPVTGIEITKTCPTIADGARVGAPISYQITVTNTGDVALSNVVVTDSRDPEWSETIPSLAPEGEPGDSVSFTFTSAITLDDATNGNVDNTATVVAAIGATALQEIAGFMGVQQPTATVGDSYHTATDGEGCSFNPVEGIAITKTCPTVADGTRIDSDIVYTVVVTNIGDVALTELNLTDSRNGGFYLNADDTTALTMPLAGVTLAPAGEDGDALTLYFRTAITPADAINGNVDNAATVSANAGAVPVTDSVTAGGEGCGFVPFSHLDVAKSCPTIATGARIDAPIVYQITLENAGDIPLTIDNVLDTRDGVLYTDPELATTAAFPLTLAREGQAGDSATLYFASAITAQDATDGNVNNTVTVQTAELPDVQAVAGAEAGCPFTPVTGIEITKTCPTIADGARVGDPIGYQITVSNTGDVELSDVIVTDARDSSWSETIPSLAREGQDGDSATLTFTGEITRDDAINGNVDNATSVTAHVGSTLEAAGEAAASQDASATVTDSYNTATDGDGCSFTPVTGVDILKACPTIADGTRVGAPISYQITVKNTGDVELSNVVVTDDRDPDWSETIASLAPAGEEGDTAQVTFTGRIEYRDAANGNVNNTAHATANVGPAQETASLVAVAQAEVTTASDSATADCPYAAFTGIDVEKGCPLAEQLNGSRVGNTISYQITVTNIGDVELHHIVVTDSRDPQWSSVIDMLAPGASTAVTYTGTITPQDAANGNVDNTVSVTGIVGDGEESGSQAFSQPTAETVSRTRTVHCAYDAFESVQITKSCPTIADGARVGDEITYDVTITNIGDVTLTGIAVSDDRDGSFDGDFPTELAPGASATRTFTSAITTTDAANGNVDNAASVTAVAGGVATDTDAGTLQTAATGAGAAIAVTVSDDVLAGCSFEPVVGLDLAKTCPDIPAGARVGDAITYEVTVTNTGDVAIAGVSISDSRDGAFDTPFPATLAPGESATRTFTSVVSLDDAQNGNVDNIALATGNVTVGDAVTALSDDATANCAFTPFVDVTVEKSGNGPIGAGEVATFTITVTNIGDVVATDVTVTDELPGSLEWTLDPAPDDCAMTDGVLDCTIHSLDAGESVDIAVSAPTTVSSCGQIVNDVAIAAANETGTDATAANNVDRATIAVECGELHVVKVLCTVDQHHDVVFEVTESGDELDDGGYTDLNGWWCAPLKDVAFTIDGDSLDAPISVMTDSDGIVDAILPPGDYTITEVSTDASHAFTVAADETTAVRVFNFSKKEPPEVVTTLPVTGSGPMPVDPEHAWLLMVMSVVLCGGAACALRRRAA